MERVLEELRSLDGILELAPQPGSEHPAISWGDHFFYYAPDGRVPTNRQPYATIITKDYPDDAESRLAPPGRWRLNIHVGARVFSELLGVPPREIDVHAADLSASDVFLPHPLYAPYGWVCIVNPGAATTDRALRLLEQAHADDRRRVVRRDRRPV